MGFRHLSITPFAIPRIKNALRQLAETQLREFVDELLRIETVREIEYFVEKQLGTDGEFERGGAQLLPQP